MCILCLKGKKSDTALPYLRKLILLAGALAQSVTDRPK